MANKSILADLILRLSANSAELTKGLAKANSNMKGAGKAASELNKEVSGAFKKISSQVDTVIPGFSTFTGSLGKALSAAKGLTGGLKLLKVALVSTGIGAIVVALGSLISYFKNTERGADAFARVLNGVKSVVSAVTRRLGYLGEAIAKLFKGDFKGAAEAAKNAFSDLGDEIKSTYKAGLDLEERRDKLEDDRIAFITKEQELQNKIAKAREVANNEDLSTLERQKALNEAIAASAELYRVKKGFAEEEADILKKQNALGENMASDNKAEAEAEAAILQLQEERSGEMRFLNSLQKRLNGEVEKETKEQEKLTLELDKQADLTNAKIIRDIVTPGIPEVPTLAPQIDTTTLAPATAQIVTMTDALQLLFTGVQAFETMPNPFEFLKGSIDDLSVELSKGAQTFKDYGRNVLSTIKNIIAGYLAESVASMIATAIKNAGKAGPLAFILAPILAATGAGLVKTAFNSLIPSFATGGLAYGPTLGIIGEYSGAKANPEVIAPLGDLKKILSESLSPFGGEVRFVIEQEQLVGILQEYNRKNIYF